jgi:coenzyme Q-binding protein COQ10
MPTHAERKKLPYSAEQMFDLVAGVEKYPEFLPWCLSAHIIKQTDTEIFADLVIGYKLVREWFTSKVMLDRPGSIRVEYLRGPMRHLANNWNFIPEPDGGCTVDFYVDFEFKNPIFQKLMGVFFNEIVRRMVDAFESRAQALYGRKKSRPASSTVKKSPAGQ